MGRSFCSKTLSYIPYNDRDMKKALVLESGGFYGAYTAGVAAELIRNLGKDYFDVIYASSVGVFTGVYLLTGQADELEDIWRNHVHDNLLVSALNPLRGKRIMDLDYLEGITKNEVLLNLDSAFSSKTKLICTLTKNSTGESRLVTPTRDNLYQVMRATASIPVICGKYNFEGVNYVDGGISKPFPVQEAIDDKCSEIIVISNLPSGVLSDNFHNSYTKRIAPFIFNRSINKHIQLRSEYRKEYEEKLKLKKVRVIRPKTNIPVNNFLDTSRERLNASVDRGIHDAQDFLNQL